MTHSWFAALILAQSVSVAAQHEAGKTTHSGLTEARHVRVFWSPDSGDHVACVNRGRVREGVATSLARPVFTSKDEGDVHLLTQPERGRYAVRLTLTDSTGARLGSRQLRSSSCLELTELVTFTLSVMLDFRVAELPQRRALASAEANGDSPTPSSATPATATPTPSTDDASDPLVLPLDRADPPPANGAPMNVALQGGGMAGVGLAPSALWGGYVGAELAVSGRARLNVMLAHGGSTAVARRGGQLRATHSEVEISACSGLFEQMWSTDLCLGAGPSLLRVSAAGYERNGGADAWNFLVSPSLQFAAPVGPSLSLTARVGLAVPLVRHDWTAAQGSTRVVLYEAPPAAFRAWFGCKVALD